MTEKLTTLHLHIIRVTPAYLYREQFALEAKEQKKSASVLGATIRYGYEGYGYFNFRTYRYTPLVKGDDHAD